MKYKDAQDKVHDIKDGFQYLMPNWPNGYTEITEDEAMSLLAPAPLTPQEQITAISNAIQKMLEEKAVALRYDSILSARSYAGYTNPFQAEALRLASFAAGCWVEAGIIEAEVMAGAPIPTVDEAMARMPVY